MTSLPSCPPSIVGKGTAAGRPRRLPRAARCQVDNRDTMTALPSCPPSIVGKGTAAGRPRRLPGR